MTDRKSIEARIAELEGQLIDAEGTPTEVYSRIVGYYRSVRNWNAGKREEYGQRLAFAMPSEASISAKSAAAAPAVKAEAAAAPALSAAPTPETASLRDGVLVFTREACPNCPPVANYVIASGMKAVFVDTDSEEGLAIARERGVLATPTVLGFDAEGRESFRAFDLASLRSRFAPSPRARVAQGAL
jgi:hypothetical protein